MNDTKIISNSDESSRLDAALQTLTARWRGVDLRQLRYFAALAREQHFGRAAQRLRISQPPLSMQIKALESRLGVQLIERGRHGAVLTPAGQALQAALARLLPAFNSALEQVVAVGRGEQGSLRVGFVTPAGSSFLPDFVRRMREQWSDIELQLAEATSDEQFPSLLDGRLDAGFVLAPVPDGLTIRAVHDEALALAMPRAWAAHVPDEPVSAAALPDAPLLVFPRDKAPALYDEIISYYAQAARVPRIGLQAIQMPTIVNLVAAGLGVALVPQSMGLSARPDVVFRSLATDGPRIRICVAWREPAHCAVLERFLDVLGSTPGTTATAA